MKKIPYETDQNNPEVKAYVEAVKKGSSTPTPQQEKTFTEKATETARDFSDKVCGVKELPQRESDYRELRTKIGEILVKNNLRTDQVAISELAKVVVTELALQRRELAGTLEVCIKIAKAERDATETFAERHRLIGFIQGLETSVALLQKETI